MCVWTWPVTSTLPTPSNETPEAPIGSVYRIDTTKKVTRLATGLKYPNGLAVTPDQKQLIVAETMTNRILSFDFQADGSLAAARTLYQFPNSSVDGIMFDEYDRLWVARWLNATVDVITLDGKLVAEIPAGGSKVTNLCFWGKSVYVTVAERHSIHRLDVESGAKRIRSKLGLGDSLEITIMSCGHSLESAPLVPTWERGRGVRGICVG